MRAVRTRSWVAKAREIAPGSAMASIERADFAWLRPEAREAFVGFGVAEEIIHSEPNGALEWVEAAHLDWSGERPAVPGPWFGGFAFDAGVERSAEWRGFGNARFVLPRFAVCARGGREWACGIGRDERAADEALAEGLPSLTAAKAQPSAPPVQRIESIQEDRAAWAALVDGALRSFRKGTAEKIVAARRLEVTLSRGADPVEIVRALAARHPACATWMLRAGPSAFIGATPETLVRADEGLVQVDALAGTLTPGSHEPTEKELREHAFVVDSVRSTLRPFSANIEVEPRPSTLALRNVVHLRTRIFARLVEGASAAAVALALHPTPAVCGTPRDVAREFIRAHEGFDRGWYCGAIGWVGEGSAHLCVALRCGVIEGNTAHLYAGAGLVAGSDAEAEWTETARKASAVIEALGGIA